MEQDSQQQEQGRAHALSFEKSDGREERVAGRGHGFKRKGARFGNCLYTLKTGRKSIRG